MTAPADLDSGGAALWQAITEAHDLDAPQLVQLEEACRAKDRCDRLDRLLRGDLNSWLSIQDFDDRRPSELVINSALTQANATANLMKQLIAALRLPDENGKKPQYRGPRGGHAPKVPGGKVSSLDRARAAKSG